MSVAYDTQNEEYIAEQIVGFMNQFLDIFSELEGKKLYLSGESVSLGLLPRLILYS